MQGWIIVLSLLTWVGVITPAIARELPSIEFLGQAEIASSTALNRVPIGGLSGITYDPKQQVYYAISDDRSQKGAARFYTLKIELQQGKLTPKGVKILGQTLLQDQPQTPFRAGEIDAEGIALSPSGELWVSSEGDASQLIPPFIRSFNLKGLPLAKLAIPADYIPQINPEQGIRNNLGFESLSITPDGRSLFTATENALYQDGDIANSQSGSRSRILRYDLSRKTVSGEFVYLTEPAPPTTEKKPAPRANGLVDLIALNPQQLLSLERSFTLSAGFQVRLFWVSLKKAALIGQQQPLTTQVLNPKRFAQKQLLFDLTTLKVPLDNLEGMTLGPQLADGRRLLILVSDNNFSPLQITQILAFAITEPR